MYIEGIRIELGKLRVRLNFDAFFSDCVKCVCKFLIKDLQFATRSLIPCKTDRKDNSACL